MYSSWVGQASKEGASPATAANNSRLASQSWLLLAEYRPNVVRHPYRMCKDEERLLPEHRET
jgi:hypothetical protein